MGPDPGRLPSRALLKHYSYINQTPRCPILYFANYAVTHLTELCIGPAPGAACLQEGLHCSLRCCPLGGGLGRMTMCRLASLVGSLVGSTPRMHRPGAPSWVRPLTQAPQNSNPPPIPGAVQAVTNDTRYSTTHAKLNGTNNISRETPSHTKRCQGCMATCSIRGCGHRRHCPAGTQRSQALHVWGTKGLFGDNQGSAASQRQVGWLPMTMPAPSRLIQGFCCYCSGKRRGFCRGFW